MISYLTVEKCRVDMLSNKYEKAITDVLEHLYTNIPLTEDKTLPFTVADYFCLTDLAPGQLLSYIRKFKKDMDPFERRVISKFLGSNQSLDTEMTMEKFKGESIAYIIDGVEKKVTDEMWQQIMDEFEQNNIPKRIITTIAPINPNSSHISESIFSHISQSSWLPIYFSGCS